jgi:hypothetical protein
MPSPLMPISHIMNTFKLMEILYREMERIEGSQEAKKALSDIFSIVLHEIQYDGIEFTSEELEKRLRPYLNDFIEVAKKTNVA